MQIYKLATGLEAGTTANRMSACLAPGKNAPPNCTRVEFCGLKKYKFEIDECVLANDTRLLAVMIPKYFFIG